MEEKIKIYVSKDINEILEKDMEFFEFYKKDGKLNKNAFITTLIKNFHESYKAQVNQKMIKVEELLKQSSTGDSILAMDIIHKISEIEYSYGEKNECVINLKPTKEIKDILKYIEDNYLDRTTLSAYFRNMFSEYCKKTQDVRERIIYRERFEKIYKAIENHNTIYFTTRSNQEGHRAIPYAIARNQEELFNYMICKYKNRPFSFRITRMQGVMVEDQISELNEQEEKVLEKMTKNSPSFAYDSFNDNSLIVVKLTEKGMKLFDKIYYFRPKPVKTEGNIYYFDCSKMQAKVYFQRFCSEALILEPKDLRGSMQHEYYEAQKKYKFEQ